MLGKKDKRKTICLEHELLLRCVQKRQHAGNVRRIVELCRQRPDWDYVVQEASRQCLGGLCYHSLKPLPPELVPEPVLRQFKAQYGHNVSTNMRLTAELCKLLKAFRARNIEVILHKGPLQASEIYGNLAFRQICDLDFIVRRQDLMAAVEVMHDHGYQFITADPREELLHRINDRSEYDCGFESSDGLVHVELHWQAMMSHSEFGLNSDYLWRHTIPVSVGGVEALGFTPEMKLFLICIHNEKHNWQYIKLLTDVSWMIDREGGPDLAQVLTAAAALNREYSVLKSLFLAAQLLEAPLPGAIQARLDAETPLKVETALHHHQIFKILYCLPLYSEWLEIISARGYLGLPPRRAWPDRLKLFGWYLRAILTPQYEDRKLFCKPLPPSLHFLYVISRIFRFIKYWALRMPGKGLG